MPEPNYHIEEADARIGLHVANSLKYDVDSVIVYSPESFLSLHTPLSQGSSASVGQIHFTHL